MLYTIKRNYRGTPALRCVWLPQHTGAKAPLTAVWTVGLADSCQETVEMAPAEPEPWLRAA